MAITLIVINYDRHSEYKFHVLLCFPNRLGALWKNLEKQDKEKYFALAREVDAEHKRKYPGEKFVNSDSLENYKFLFLEFANYYRLTF